MKWLEIIKVSSPVNCRDSVESEIKNMIARSKGQAIQRIRVFQNAAAEDSLKIHLYWDSERAEPGGSALGLCLVHILKEQGLISHSVWIERASAEARRTEK
jgi:hypothetical protein